MLIDTELVDFDDLVQEYPGLPEFNKAKQGILCLLRHIMSSEIIVLGNAHFEHSPVFDHVKFAQACFYLEKIANFIKNKKTNT